jgi:heme/copper-type cytochrome/quinol oxidase subunit 3
MRERWPILAFIALQAVVSAGWLSAWLSIAPEAATGMLNRGSAQLWSASGPGVGGELIDPWNELLTATLLLLGSAASAFMSRQDFIAGHSARAALYLAAALGLSAISIWLIAAQWTEPTVFPEGYPDIALIFAATRAFITQFFIGYLVLTGYLMLVVLGKASAPQPRGFHLAVVNWWVVTASWALLYLAAYAGPQL